jgi:hypothetical protein
MRGSSGRSGGRHGFFIDADDSEMRLPCWYNPLKETPNTRVIVQKAVLVKGRLTSPTSVELDEAVAGMTVEVEVLLRPDTAPSPSPQTVSSFLQNLPPGTRSKEDIDQQIQAERTNWGDR